MTEEGSDPHPDDHSSFSSIQYQPKHIMWHYSNDNNTAAANLNKLHVTGTNIWLAEIPQTKTDKPISQNKAYFLCSTN